MAPFVVMVGRDRRRRAASDEPWRALLGAQSGVVSRSQLLGCGLSKGQIGALLDARRWSGLLPGVYAAFSGPVPARARAWAAVLYAGDRAALAGDAALWLWGLADAPPAVMTVRVPGGRQVRHQPGVHVLRTEGEIRTHPAAMPPRLRVEDAVLDVAARAAPEQVVGLVLRATASRVTTPERLLAALALRVRVRHRRLLLDLLRDARDGVQSALEHRWGHTLERPHGLPRAERNVPDDRGPRRQYRDLRYRRWGLVVELDGVRWHPEWTSFRDRRRDNESAMRGEIVLRYGWHEIVADPCGVAASTAEVLAARGWTGRPRPCGPGCPVGQPVTR